MLSRMLVVDSKKRATIAEIKAHAWATLGAPLLSPASYLPAPRKKLTTDAIDNEILAELNQMGFENTDVIKAISDNNTIAQSYYFYTLMLREKIKQKEQEQIDKEVAKTTNSNKLTSPRHADTTEPSAPNAIAHLTHLTQKTDGRRYTWGCLDDLPHDLPAIAKETKETSPVSTRPTTPNKENLGAKSSFLGTQRKTNFPLSFSRNAVEEEE